MIFNYLDSAIMDENSSSLIDFSSYIYIYIYYKLISTIDHPLTDALTLKYFVAYPVVTAQFVVELRITPAV